jgi:hypothetical protein
MRDQIEGFARRCCRPALIRRVAGVSTGERLHDRKKNSTTKTPYAIVPNDRRQFGNLVGSLLAVSRPLHWKLKMLRKPLIVVSSLSLFCFGIAQAAELSAEDAPTHVGESTTICGTVVSAKYAERTRGQPTFLNLDKPYPQQIFTAVIWGTNRQSFGTPETALLGRHVCVSGLIQLYRQRPEIILRSPSQLTTR